MSAAAAYQPSAWANHRISRPAKAGRPSIAMGMWDCAEQQHGYRQRPGTPIIDVRIETINAGPPKIPDGAHQSVEEIALENEIRAMGPQPVDWRTLGNAKYESST